LFLYSRTRLSKVFFIYISGKYIIKIVVKQGDPSKVYHFAQTLRFINEDHKHHDEDFKVLWGFYRSNMGKVDAIKGT
jgi:hypothetical protein